MYQPEEPSQTFVQPTHPSVCSSPTLSVHLLPVFQSPSGFFLAFLKTAFYPVFLLSFLPYRQNRGRGTVCSKLNQSVRRVVSPRLEAKVILSEKFKYHLLPHLLHLTQGYFPGQGKFTHYTHPPCSIPSVLYAIRVQGNISSSVLLYWIWGRISHPSNPNKTLYLRQFVFMLKVVSLVMLKRETYCLKYEQ